ncbi:proline iminopeptidase [Acrasis kona]|uniref:Proline iminopeptidase n=1 Tax=Acrasis kona TaxID=1008807 RepID=A0AAW2YYJ7_9EUKA
MAGMSTLNHRDRLILNIYKILYTGHLRLYGSFIPLSSILKISALALLSAYTSYKIISYYINSRIKKCSSIPSYRIPLRDMMKDDAVIKGLMMDDGRWISYCEYGNLNSPNVIFYCHSLGGSRLERHPNHEQVARELNVRFIHLDRPGYGQSTTHDERTYLTFAHDLNQVSKALHIERYAVMGVSSGAPYALACAHYHQKHNSDKLVCAVAVSSDLPYRELPECDYSPYLKDYQFLIRFAPFLLRVFMNVEIYKNVFSNPERYTQHILHYESTLYEHEGDDLKTFLHSCVDFMREGMNAHGIQEPFREVKMERSEWGFQLNDIVNIPIIFWHGARNKLIPIKLVRKITDKMEAAGCRVNMNEVAKRGHYFYMNTNRWREMIVHCLLHFKT